MGRRRFAAARPAGPVAGRMAPDAGRRRAPGGGLAQGVRRRRPDRAGAGGAGRGVRQGRRAHPDRQRRLRHGDGRADDHRVGHRGAEAPLPAPDHFRRGPVVPGLLGAQRRVRSRQHRHPGRAGWRRVGDQRPEDLDLVRPHRQLDFRAGPHRPGSDQARRHHVPAGADGTARRRGPADPRDDRRGAVQRGLLHRRPHGQAQRGRSDQQRVDRRQHAARLRAGRSLDGAVDRLPQGAGSDHRPGQGPGQDIRPNHPPAAGLGPLPGRGAALSGHAVAHQRPGRREPRPGGVDHQAVLERVPQAGHRAVARHPGRRGDDAHR